MLLAADKTFVINLDTRPDRRRETIDALTQRFGAAVVDERLEIYSVTRPQDRGQFASIGVRGVFESHLGVLRHARELGLDSVLILEDDIDLTAGVEEMSRALKLLAQSEWDYASLGAQFDELYHLTPNEFVVGALQRTFGDRYPIPSDGGVVEAADGDIRVVRMRGGHIGAHCVLVRAPIFDDLIAHLQRCYEGPIGDDVFGPIPVDGAYSTFSWVSPAVRVVVEPSLAGQRSSRSDITPGRLDRVPMVAQAVESIRRGRRKASQRLVRR